MPVASRTLFHGYLATASGARYQQLARHIRELIVDGQLSLGSRLPSERIVAADLRLSRTTVQNAYRELERWGLLQIRPKSGAVVCGLATRGTPVSRLPLEVAPRVPTVASTFLEDLMESASRTVNYPFETGFADPKLFPIDEFTSVVEEVFSGRLREALNYGPTAGMASLRHAIAQYLCRHRGLVGVEADDVFITSGSIQALSLIADAFVRTGDIVVIESPSFPGAIQLFRNAGATLVDIPIDDEGMQVDDLDRLFARVHPRLVYVQPTVHNPTGTSMSAQRRAELIRAAQHWGVLVVEDDAYGVLSRADIPPLLTDPRERLGFYVGTFSKTIASGLRVGYVVADRGLIRPLAITKQLSDLHTSNISQLLVEGWLTTGDVGAHIARCRETYGLRVAAALDEIEEGDALEPYLTPVDGFYLYCRALGGVSAARIRRASLESGVTFSLGEYFNPRGNHRDCLRICVCALDVRDVRAGIRRLLQVARETAHVRREAPMFQSHERGL